MNQPNFDASSDPDPAHESDEDRDRQPRPFLGIRFNCCRVYARIYRNDERTAYAGRCPKCRAAINVPIGTGGTSSRFFEAR